MNHRLRTTLLLALSVSVLAQSPFTASGMIRSGSPCENPQSDGGEPADGQGPCGGGGGSGTPGIGNQGTGNKGLNDVPKSSSISSNPVNWNGRFQVKHGVDISIPVKFGYELTVDRLYSGAYGSWGSASKYPFGENWWFRWDTNIQYSYLDGSGNPVYRWFSPSSAEFEFRYSGTTNIFRTDPAEDAPMELEVLKSGSTITGFKIINAGGELYEFDANGRIVAFTKNRFTTNIADDKLTFVRDTNAGAGEGRLLEMHAPGSDDRYLLFTYDAVEVTDLVKVTLKSTTNTTLADDVVFYSYNAAGNLYTVRANSASNYNAIRYNYGTATSGTGCTGSHQVNGNCFAYSDWPNELGMVSVLGPGSSDVTPIVKYQINGYGETEVVYLFKPGSTDFWETNVEWDPTSQGMKFYDAGYTACPTTKTFWTHDTYGSYLISQTYSACARQQHQWPQLLAGRKLWESRQARLDATNWAEMVRYSHDTANSNFLEKNRPIWRRDYQDNTIFEETKYSYSTTFPNRVTKIENYYGASGQDVNLTWVDTDEQQEHDWGLLRSEVYADGSYVEYEYSYSSGNNRGLVTSIETEDGAVTFEYADNVHGKRGLPTKITYPDGNEVTLTYDNYSNVKTRAVSHLGTTTYTYSNELGSSHAQFTVIPRLVAVEDASSNDIAYEYDAWGRTTKVTDPLNKVTEMAYDRRGRLESVKNPANEWKFFEYDFMDRLTAYKERSAGSGSPPTYTYKTWSYLYDSFGRKIRETDPDNEYKEFEYMGDVSVSGCTPCAAYGKSNLVASIKQEDNKYIHFRYLRTGAVKSVYYENGSTPSDPPEIAITYDRAGRMTEQTDNRLNLGDEKYLWTYKSATGQLERFVEPDGWYRDYYYDSVGRLEAYRDVDGGVHEYDYDAHGRLDTITDPFHGVVDWTRATTSDTSYPVGAVKELLYANGAKQAYTYDSLGRLSSILHRDDTNFAFDGISLTYNAASLITRRDRGSWRVGYTYDNAYRMTEEKMYTIEADYSKRTYTYDAWGNRASMTQWNSASVNKSTTYTYGNRNQMTQNSGYYLEGTTDTGQLDFTYDDKGNMTGRDWGAFDVSYTWNADNRLTKVDTVESSEASTAVDYHYNAAGERILRRGPYDGMAENPTKVRQRFFFRGLTEEVTKHSVAGAHADSAFEYLPKEDGESASEWASSGSGTTISVVNDTARRSNVIKCDSGAAKRTFYVGDASGTGHNPNDTPWNAAKRTLSFWVRSGELTQVTVYLTSSAGERQLRYKPDQSGTNSVDGSGHVTFFLPSDDTDNWMRFERNIEADYEAHAGGASWTDTDGLGFVFGNAEESHIVYVDDIRLSDSLTVEHNTLGPGVIGHIMRNRTWDATTLARTDRWFHYDQVGTVISTTGADGAAVDMNWFDAFGNTLEDWETGLVASGGGWGLHSKSRDPLAAMHYMSQRWYAADLGVFASVAPTSAIEEGRFVFADGVPVSLIDADGRMPTWRIGDILVKQNITDHAPPHFDVVCDAGKFKVGQNMKPIEDGVKLPGFLKDALETVKPQLRKHMKKVMKARRGTPKGVIGRGGGVEMVVFMCVIAGEAAAEQVDQKIVQPTVTRGQRGRLGNVTHLGHGAGNAAYDLVPFE